MWLVSERWRREISGGVRGHAPLGNVEIYSLWHAISCTLGQDLEGIWCSENYKDMSTFTICWEINPNLVIQNYPNTSYLHFKHLKYSEENDTEKQIQAYSLHPFGLFWWIICPQTTTSKSTNHHLKVHKPPHQSSQTTTSKSPNHHPKVFSLFNNLYKYIHNNLYLVN